MTEPPNDSRQRMIRAAASMIGARGLNATSFSDLLAESGAPRGSIYHHFPQGKTQLAADAIRWTSARVLAYQQSCAADTPAGILRHFAALWEQVAQTPGGRGGCVVAGVTLDTASDDVPPPLLTLARDTFQDWVTLLSTQFSTVGLPPRQAQALALTLVAGMEGALILCRAEGNAQPIATVTEQLLRLLPHDSNDGPGTAGNEQ